MDSLLASDEAAVTGIYKDESAVQRSVQTLTHTCRLLPVTLENVPVRFNEIWCHARRMCCKADEI